MPKPLVVNGELDAVIGTYCSAVAARSGLDPSAVEAGVVFVRPDGLFVPLPL